MKIGDDVAAFRIKELLAERGYDVPGSVLLLVIRGLIDDGWIICETKVVAVMTEALRQSCGCAGPQRDPAGNVVPHARDCPMFPFERPGMDQSIAGHLAALARFDQLATQAVKRVGG